MANDLMDDLIDRLTVFEAAPPWEKMALARAVISQAVEVLRDMAARVEELETKLNANVSPREAETQSEINESGKAS